MWIYCLQEFLFLQKRKSSGSFSLFHEANRFFLSSSFEVDKISLVVEESIFSYLGGDFEDLEVTLRVVDLWGDRRGGLCGDLCGTLCGDL